MGNGTAPTPPDIITVCCHGRAAVAMRSGPWPWCMAYQDCRALISLGTARRQVAVLLASAALLLLASCTRVGTLYHPGAWRDHVWYPLTALPELLAIALLLGQPALVARIGSAGNWPPAAAEARACRCHAGLSASVSCGRPCRRAAVVHHGARVDAVRDADRGALPCMPSASLMRTSGGAWQRNADKGS